MSVSDHTGFNFEGLSFRGSEMSTSGSGLLGRRGMMGQTVGYSKSFVCVIQPYVRSLAVCTMLAEISH